MGTHKLHNLTYLRGNLSGCLDLRGGSSLGSPVRPAAVRESGFPKGRRSPGKVKPPHSQVNPKLTGERKVTAPPYIFGFSHF